MPPSIKESDLVRFVSERNLMSVKRNFPYTLQLEGYSFSNFPATKELQYLFICSPICKFNLMQALMRQVEPFKTTPLT
jgi:hypothetical protein